MKKTLAFLLLLLTVLLIFSACADPETCVHDVVKGRCRHCRIKPSAGLEFAYDGDKDGYRLVGMGDCTDEVLIVPARYEGKAVIAASGFMEDGFVKKLYLPASVTELSATFFYGSSALEEVYLQGAVAVEGFKNCAVLKKVYFSSAVKGLGDAFGGTPLLSEVIMEDGRESLFYSYGGFYESGLLENMSLYTDGGMYLGDFLLAVDPDVSEFTVRDGTRNMAVNAFRGCESLTALTIGKNVEFDSVTHSMDGETFADCIRLTKLVTASDCKVLDLPKYLEILEYRQGVTAIGVANNCKNLKQVVIAEGVRSLPPNAFSGCKALGDVSLPSTLQSVGARAFAGCSALRSVTLKEGLVSIENNAFEACTALDAVKLPSTLKYLGTGAFLGTAITYLVIPSGLDAVGGNISNAATYYCGVEAEGKNWSQSWAIRPTGERAAVYYKGEWTYENGKPVPMA